MLLFLVVTFAVTLLCFFQLEWIWLRKKRRSHDEAKNPSHSEATTPPGVAKKQRSQEAAFRSLNLSCPYYFHTISYGSSHWALNPSFSIAVSRRSSEMCWAKATRLPNATNGVCVHCWFGVCDLTDTLPSTKGSFNVFPTSIGCWNGWGKCQAAHVHVPSHFPSQPVDGSRLLHYHHHQDQCQYGTSMSGNIWSGAAAVDPMIHKSTAALSGFWRTMSALGRWRICPTHLHPIFARRALFATISSWGALLRVQI